MMAVPVSLYSDELVILLAYSEYNKLVISWKTYEAVPASIAIEKNRMFISSHHEGVIIVDENGVTYNAPIDTAEYVMSVTNANPEIPLSVILLTLPL